MSEWVHVGGGGEAYLTRLQERGILDEADHLFDLEDEALRTGDSTKLDEYLGEPLTAEEAIRLLRERFGNND